jgi:hypothetical protein
MIRALNYAGRARAARVLSKERFPKAVAILEGYSGSNQFIANVATKFDRYGSISEAQAAAVEAAFTRDVVRSVESSPVVVGRGVVTGEIMSKKEKDSEYGFYFAITVRDERGFTLWGRIPAAIADAAIGVKVTFTATLSKSDRDDTFGFFKRASKASIAA